jgi:hypothetical protein
VFTSQSISSELRILAESRRGQSVLLFFLPVFSSVSYSFLFSSIGGLVTVDSL